MSDKNNNVEDLEKLRKDIDHIDKNVVDLLTKRGETVIKIGKIKKELNVDIEQVAREKEIIEKLKKESKVLKSESIEAIWKEIISACKLLQGYITKVGYLGPRGSFTHQAAQEFFPKAGTEFVSCKNVVEIFDTIEKNMFDFGMIPIENSLEGTVSENLDLLMQKNLNIFGEIELRIVQNLISVKDANLSTVKNIYSHPQAFAQTKSWIKVNLPAANLINTNSTSEAVQMVKDLNDKKNAAIGTDFARILYDLNTLSSNIEDNPSNYTRFLVISKRENNTKNVKKIKTSIVFVIKHIPGALYHVLKIFADANINLTKIESRPRREGATRWDYIFLMDFEGDKENSKIQKVLEELNSKTIWSKILGSYPSSGSL